MSPTATAPLQSVPFIMRNALLVSLFLTISVFAGPAEFDIGERELMQFAATVAGLVDFDGGRAAFQKTLETEYPVGTARRDVAGRLADTQKELHVPSGYRTLLENYDNSIYLTVDRTIGSAVARLAIEYSFDEQGHLTSVLSVMMFDTSRAVCVWPKGTGGPVRVDPPGPGEGPARQQATPAPKP